jgi:tetratricopeptide (TPR) repeat protein
MHSNRFVVIASATVAAALLMGCQRKQPKAEEEQAVEPDMTALQEVPPNPLYDLYAAVDAKLEAGDKEGATREIIGALDNTKYAENKAELFTTIIRFLLHTEQVDEAKTRFLNMIRTEPELATPGFDLIYGYHVQQGDGAATLEWVRQLMLQPLTPAMKRPASEWLLVALLETGATDELAEKLAPFLEEFSADDGAQVVQRLCSTAQQAQQFDAIDRIVATVAASTKKGEPVLANAVLTSRILAQLGRDQWDAVAEALPDAVATLPDGPLQMVFSNIASATRRGKVPDRLETMAEKVLRTVALEKTGARNAAAREWVNATVEQRNLAAVPARIGELIALKVPPRQVYSSISRHFYAMLEKPEILKALLVQADVLSPLLEEDSTRNALNALMLDGCFVVEDYDRALKLLETGIADRDESWHAMAITKVKAHKALQAKNVDEAVKQFRAFMEIIAKSEEDSPDPVTNVVHTRDMILGRNAKRIGDIYKDAGRAEEAKKAYGEAKAFYEKALDANKAGEETEKLIRKELGEIPAN